MGPHVGGLVDDEGNVGLVLLGRFIGEDPTAVQVEA